MRAQLVGTLQDLLNDLKLLQLGGNLLPQTNKDQSASKLLSNQAIFHETVNDRREQFEKFYAQVLDIENNLDEQRLALVEAEDSSMTEEEKKIWYSHLHVYYLEVKSFVALLLEASQTLVKRIEEKKDKHESKMYAPQCTQRLLEKEQVQRSANFEKLAQFSQSSEGQLSPSGFIVKTLFPQYSKYSTEVRWSITKYRSDMVTRDDQLRFLAGLSYSQEGYRIVLAGLLLVKHQIERDSYHKGEPTFFMGYQIWTGSKLKELIQDYLQSAQEHLAKEGKEFDCGNFLEALENSEFMKNQEIPDNFRNDLAEAKEKYLAMQVEAGAAAEGSVNNV